MGSHHLDGGFRVCAYHQISDRCYWIRDTTDTRRLGARTFLAGAKPMTCGQRSKDEHKVFQLFGFETSEFLMMGRMRNFGSVAYPSQHFIPTLVAAANQLEPLVKAHNSVN